MRSFQSPDKRHDFRCEVSDKLNPSTNDYTNQQPGAACLATGLLAKWEAEDSARASAVLRQRASAATPIVTRDRCSSLDPFTYSSPPSYSTSSL